MSPWAGVAMPGEVPAFAGMMGWVRVMTNMAAGHDVLGGHDGMGAGMTNRAAGHDVLGCGNDE